MPELKLGRGWTLTASRRIISLLVMFLGVTFIIYAMVYALPGDPIRALAGDRPLPDATVRALRAKYHLDDPLIVQYLDYLRGLAHLDFGVNFSGNSVGSEMVQRWPITITLGLTAWVIEIVLGISLGVVAALKRGTWVDYVIITGTILVSAVPIVVLGWTAQLVLGVQWSLFPIAGTTDGWPRSFILPAVLIALFDLAAISQLTRGSVLENMRADYARTARAKGMSEMRVIGVHVMRNAVIPTTTYLAMSLGFLLSGTIVIEGIFNLPGVGNLLFQAIRMHEGPTVVGVSTAMVLIFLLTSVLADLLHAVLDPRIRHD